jgi:hypothetical protein
MAILNHAAAGNENGRVVLILWVTNLAVLLSSNKSHPGNLITEASDGVVYANAASSLMSALSICDANTSSRVAALTMNGIEFAVAEGGHDDRHI